MSNFQVLDDIYEIVKSRMDSDPKESYTAKLFKKGREKITKKLGEEAVELVIEGVADKKKEAISESADVLFHMLVLWADMGINPDKVMRELTKRRGMSGIEEKASRKED